MLLLATILSLLPVLNFKYVTSVLNAKWGATPLAMEASEFLAEEDNTLFFEFISRQESSGAGTEEEEYNSAITVAGNMLPDVSISLLKLSLSLRQYSVRIVMFNEISINEKGSLDCDAFFQINRKHHCITPDVDNLLKSAESSTERVELNKHDHIYREVPGSPQVILYCDIREEGCRTANTEFMDMADKGLVSYVFRHHYKAGTGKVQLSGYGVELAIKSTEYTAVDDTVVTEGEKQEILKTREEEEVEGFVFGTLKDKYPDSVEDLDKFRDFLIDNKDDMKPLKAWEITDLGYQASQKVVSSSSTESLAVLAKYSQNLPSLARSLSRTQVNNEMRKEIKQNQAVLERYNVNPGDSVLLLNGMLIDLENADPFKLLKKLRNEAKIVGGLSSLGISSAQMNQLLKADLYKQGAKYGIDMRDEAVLYVNDLEQDEEFAYWPSGIQELLRPSYPGSLKHLRKNINNVVMVMRASDEQVIELFTLLEAILENNVPIRIGLVFASESATETPADVDHLLPAMLNRLLQKKGRTAVKKFILKIAKSIKKTGITADKLQSKFSEIISDVISEQFVSDNSALLTAGNSFVSARGVNPCSVIANGVVIDKLGTLEATLLETLHSQLPKLQRAVYMGLVNDETHILDWYMNTDSILPRYNPQIMDPEAYSLPLTDLDIAGPVHEELDEFLLETLWLGRAEEAAVSMVAVGDYSSSSGRQLVLALLDSIAELQHTRVSFLFTSDTAVSRGIWAALRVSLSGGEEEILAAIRRTLEGADEGEVNEREAHIFSQIVGNHETIAEVVLRVPPGNTAVLCNGRVVTSLRDVTKDDVVLLEKLELRSGAGTISEVLLGEHLADESMRAASLLRKQEPSKRISFPELKGEHSAVVVPGQGPFEVEAVLDPLSSGAQQISQILKVLHEAKLITLRLILNPRDKLSEIPVKRFYRYVLEPELRFSPSGAVADIGSRFTELLPHLLLTMSLSTPVNWMVASSYSPHDLDNIRLTEIEQGIRAEYALEYLVIEGHSHDPARYNNPTQGLQYELSAPRQDKHDTIVMANLGYFQLKSGPGVWRLALREGSSKTIYKIEGVEGPATLDTVSGDVVVPVGDLTSTFITVDASKRPGMEERSVLEDNTNTATKPNRNADEDAGIWDSLKSFVGGSDDHHEKSNVTDTINIFSVASGHLYERMLGVMMQTVLANTNNPVKFWFLKNYLSPKFINSIPTIAKELGCEVEFVQYQWPSWLHAQTEKQRIIWGYKILFLDVLFPMNLKKIIFVDADQIVRADMKELIDMDLHGAPYGYTPFCDDRTEMDGFRFWNQGYWRNHLMGRKYHISALYVVDLQKFRLVSAGDRLRGQYQGLSQDPNSLANLDQDLPNNMIHHVKIHSLPQEWLWCETWCSDSSKESAKTIDLCNNPQTKEPKLDRAMRIAPEWREYDKKLKKILEKVDHSTDRDSYEKQSPPSDKLSDKHSEL